MALKRHVSVLYRVKPGDTMLMICRTHGLSFTDFSVLNPQFDSFGCRNPDVIFDNEIFVVGLVPYDPLMFTKESK